MNNQSILMSFILKHYYNFSISNEFLVFFECLCKLENNFSPNTKIEDNLKPFIEDLKKIYKNLIETNQTISLNNKVLIDSLNVLVKNIESSNVFNIDQLPAIIQLKSGAGGTEAGIFANDVYQSYISYLRSKGLKYEIISESLFECIKTSYREITFKVDKKAMFGLFKSEIGVHRVQRVPITEHSDRIHTSTIAVSILPLLQNNKTIVIPQSHLKIEHCRSSGAGGQHVNTTDSAARITYLPLNISVTIQGRSYHDNLALGMDLLKSKILESMSATEMSNLENAKRSQIKNMERNEKIRTYNYTRRQIIDHRFEGTKINFDNFFAGKLDDNFEKFRNIIKLYALLQVKWPI